MNQELIDIAIQRGRLLERISNQRQLLAQQLQPLEAGLAAADRAVVTLRNGSNYLKQNPEVVTVAVAVLVVLQPRRVWRWSKRGFFAWRTWRMLRTQMLDLGLVTRP
ncbi:MAG: hypothetical protein KBE22_06180 [Candidatus Accumulibacter sp.]|uniref:YqjK-like protein n=1 Tax=Candidatus Accumulibacter affinis TaxID=2954384 RepID=A0A935TEI4_9PROT|nr:hypothetical protein [Candidatus Accumulibacter affinis]MBP9804473.1 hypothetical protein [Accumulibacter sp.]